MFAKIITAIWQFLASGAAYGAKTTASFLDYLLTLPGRMLGSSSPKTPLYDPSTTTSEIVATLDEARKKAAAKLHKPDIEKVRDWLRTHRDDRAKKKLPESLPPHVRQALLTLPEEAITILARVEEGYLRRYLKGGMHAIGGVPEFQNVYMAIDKLPNAEDVLKFNVQQVCNRRQKAEGLKQSLNGF